MLYEERERESGWWGLSIVGLRIKEEEKGGTAWVRMVLI